MASEPLTHNMSCLMTNIYKTFVPAILLTQCPVLPQFLSRMCKYKLYPGENHTIILVSRLSKTTQFILSHLRFTRIIVVKTTSLKFVFTF
jgi:hypothetical protein